MKLFRVDHIICNSNFTKEFIDHEYGVESLVIYPPVDTENFKAKRKEDLILCVGRFSELLQSKGQEVLVKEFKKFFDKGNKKWKLVLAGGAEVGSKGMLERIKKSSVGYPIKVVVSPSFKDLKDLYGKAKIYWAATGFGVEEAKEPEKVEHFGISVVEAMSAGCVPLVYSAGGHKEIVVNNVNGYLWDSLQDLQEKTMKVVEDRDLLKGLSLGAVLSSKKYSYERFKLDVTKVL
jgi:glycosyltransferase involved in cell wall biosynthesis